MAQSWSHNKFQAINQKLKNVVRAMYQCKKHNNKNHENQIYSKQQQNSYNTIDLRPKKNTPKNGGQLYLQC